MTIGNLVQLGSKGSMFDCGFIPILRRFLQLRARKQVWKLVFPFTTMVAMVGGECGNPRYGQDWTSREYSMTESIHSEFREVSCRRQRGTGQDFGN